MSGTQESTTLRLPGLAELGRRSWLEPWWLPGSLRMRANSWSPEELGAIQLELPPSDRFGAGLLPPSDRQDLGTRAADPGARTSGGDAAAIATIKPATRPGGGTYALPSRAVTGSGITVLIVEAGVPDCYVNFSHQVFSNLGNKIQWIKVEIDGSETVKEVEIERINSFPFFLSDHATAVADMVHSIAPGSTLWNGSADDVELVLNKALAGIQSPLIVNQSYGKKTGLLMPSAIIQSFDKTLFEKPNVLAVSAAGNYRGGGNGKYPDMVGKERVANIPDNSAPKNKLVVGSWSDRDYFFQEKQFFFN